MILLIKLFLAHLLGDFFLQPDKWVKDKKLKKEKSKKLYLHILLHFLLMLGIIFDAKYLIPIICIAISHYLIDLIKLYVETKNNMRLVFFADQLAHLVVITITADFYSPFLQKVLKTINLDEIYLLLIAILLLTNVGSKIIKIVISRWTPETEDNDEESLSNAGNYIGILERMFIFGFIITNNLQAVGFLLAAKSVFRFGDLKESKDRKLTEYILIGTLISFGLAITVGYIYISIKI